MDDSGGGGCDSGGGTDTDFSDTRDTGGHGGSDVIGGCSSIETNHSDSFGVGIGGFEEIEVEVEEEIEVEIDADDDYCDEERESDGYINDGAEVKTHKKKKVKKTVIVKKIKRIKRPVKVSKPVQDGKYKHATCNKKPRSSPVTSTQYYTSRDHVATVRTGPASSYTDGFFRRACFRSLCCFLVVAVVIVGIFLVVYFVISG